MKELDHVSPESIGISSAVVKECVEALNHEKTQIHGFMAARQGKVFAECWWKPYTSKIPHSCHSMGKSYTVTAIGIACTEGILSMEDRIADLFADEIKQYNIKQTEMFERLKIKHLVTMSNGMEYMSPLTDDWIIKYLENPVVYEPGTQFLYNTAGSCMLGAIIEKKTEKSLLEYLTEKCFNIIGIDKDSIQWLKFKNGNTAEPGCFSTTENNLRLGMLFANHGCWDGVQLIDKSWMEEALSFQIQSKGTQIDERCGYGYQLWNCSVPGVYRFDGGQGQFCIMWPEKDIVVSIQEGGIYPDGPQRTLETVYQKLFTAVKDKPLDENPAAYQQLKEFTSSRSIPCDKPNTYIPKADFFTGFYEIIDGDAEPWIAVAPEGINFFASFYDNSKQIRMEKLSFAVDADKVTMKVNEFAEFSAWFDGKHHLRDTENVCKGVTKTCSTAYFVDDSKLVITTRYINGWFKNVLTFERSGDKLIIDVKKDTLNENHPYYTQHSIAKKNL